MVGVRRERERCVVEEGEERVVEKREAHWHDEIFFLPFAHM